MTVAEFMQFDDGTDTRYELVRGVPAAMAPPSGLHVEISSRIFRILSRQLAQPCRALSGGGVSLALDDVSYREPDLFVSCEPLPDQIFSQPRLIVEVLSPSTEKEDRSTKLDFYKSFPSCEAILHVWQDRRRAELHLREGASWRVTDTIGAGTVDVPSLGVRLDLDEVYPEGFQEMPDYDPGI
jgi:Uma2 family endonuclease